MKVVKDLYLRIQIAKKEACIDDDHSNDFIHGNKADTIKRCLIKIRVMTPRKKI